MWHHPYSDAAFDAQPTPIKSRPHRIIADQKNTERCARVDLPPSGSYVKRFELGALFLRWFLPCLVLASAAEYELSHHAYSDAAFDAKHTSIKSLPHRIIADQKIKEH